MFVRVFDLHRNTYFKSEVYAIINSGWYEKQLVVVPSDSGNHLKFVDCLDKSDPKHPKVLINRIIPDSHNGNLEWIHQRSDNVDKQLDDFAELLDKNTRFFDYYGYSWVYDNKPLLLELLKGGEVSTKGYEHQMRALNAYRLKGWHYVETQQDVDYIFEQTGGFHDSVIKELNYISGAYVKV